MNHSTLPTRGLRKIHTPAICDCEATSLEIRTDAGLAGSTVPIQAVHIRGPRIGWPSVRAALGTGSRS